MCSRECGARAINEQHRSPASLGTSRTKRFHCNKYGSGYRHRPGQRSRTIVRRQCRSPHGPSGRSVRDPSPTSIPDRAGTAAGARPSPHHDTITPPRIMLYGCSGRLIGPAICNAAMTANCGLLRRERRHSRRGSATRRHIHSKPDRCRRRGGRSRNPAECRCCTSIAAGLRAVVDVHETAGLRAIAPDFDPTLFDVAGRPEMLRLDETVVRDTITMSVPNPIGRRRTADASVLSMIGGTPYVCAGCRKRPLSCRRRSASPRQPDSHVPRNVPSYRAAAGRR